MGTPAVRGGTWHPGPRPRPIKTRPRPSPRPRPRRPAQPRPPRPGGAVRGECGRAGLLPFLLRFLLLRCFLLPPRPHPGCGPRTWTPARRRCSGSPRTRWVGSGFSPASPDSAPGSRRLVRGPFRPAGVEVHAGVGSARAVAWTPWRPGLLLPSQSRTRRRGRPGRRPLRAPWADGPTPGVPVAPCPGPVSPRLLSSTCRPQGLRGVSPAFPDAGCCGVRSSPVVQDSAPAEVRGPGQVPRAGGLGAAGQADVR